jgi:hypothetical protein
MTVTTAAAIIRQRELARRVSSGLEVRYLASETTLRFAVPADQALDAFYHPLAHVDYSIAP